MSDTDARRSENATAVYELVRAGKTKMAAELVAGLARIAAEAVKAAHEAGEDRTFAELIRRDSAMIQGASFQLARDLSDEAAEAMQILVKSMVDDIPESFAEETKGDPLSRRLLDLAYHFPHRGGAYALIKEGALAAAALEGTRAAEVAAARARTEARERAARPRSPAPDGPGDGAGIGGGS